MTSSLHYFLRSGLRQHGLQPSLQLLGMHEALRARRAQSILEFEEYVANDKENQDDSVTRAAIALLGDLAANLPATGPLFQGKAWVTDLLGQACTPRPASSLHHACSPGHACRQPAWHGPSPGQGLGLRPAGPGMHP